MQITQDQALRIPCRAALRGPADTSYPYSPELPSLNLRISNVVRYEDHHALKICDADTEKVYPGYSVRNPRVLDVKIMCVLDTKKGAKLCCNKNKDKNKRGVR